MKMNNQLIGPGLVDYVTGSNNAINADFIKAQKEIQNPTKNAVNPHFKNKYANLETVIDTIKAVMLANNFAVIQSSHVEAGCVVVTTAFLHTSGGRLMSSTVVPLEKMSPQAGMSALTYGRRYGLLSALCLAAEDDDGNEATLNDPSKLAKAMSQTAPKPVVTSNFSKLNGKA